jgi:folate-binding protein YgfZ
MMVLKKRLASVIPEHQTRKLCNAKTMTNRPDVRLNGEILAIEGADALAFAQAQTMNDVTTLQDGGWHWSGWLSARGRIVAFFALARVSAQSLLLWLPAGGAGPLRERLARYVFRSKVTLRVREDLACIGCWSDAPVAREEAGAVARLPMPARADGARTLVLRPAAGAASGAPSDDEEDRARWRLADLHAGVPYIAADAVNSEQFVPQWLSLERLGAFSVKKGCYPGQEIVARMHFLGQSKRAAYVLRGEGAAPAPLARVLTADGGGAGEIVWAQATEGEWHALAGLAVDKAGAVSAVDGAGAARVVSRDG